MRGRSHLRNRILAAVTGLSLLTCVVFSFYTVAFTYSVEDSFLAARLETEAVHQRQARALTGEWAAPRDDRLSLHEGPATLPVSIREVLSEEPERVEFQAPGPSHYHLLALEAGGSRAWLVYDAGNDLIVPAMRNKLFGLLGLTTLVLVACALAVAYLISRRITRRLEHLATTVAELDPDRMSGNWGPAAGKDEVGVVAAGLEAMTARLRAFIQRERSFTRDASHELRTPLAVIRSAGDQLVRQPELSELSRQHATLIRESTERLEQTVTTLLALAREEHAGGAEDVQLLPLIEQAVIDQSPRLDGKPVEVIVEVPPSTRLASSPTVARILLANLVGNAFSHTKAGGVRIDTHEGRLRIANSFAQDNAKNSCELGANRPNSDGFGFGLGIVRRLCGQLGLRFDLRVEGDTVIATLSLARSQ